jgi:hypothetical protein
MQPRLLHLGWNKFILFAIAVWDSLVLTLHYSLAVPPLAEGLLDALQFRVITNEAAVNMGTHVTWVHVCLDGHMPSSPKEGSGADEQGCSTARFSLKKCFTIYSPTSDVCGFLPAPHLTLSVVHFSQPDGNTLGSELEFA